MIRTKIIISLLISTLFFTNCAKRGSISGGLKDTLAPKILFTTPPNLSTNFQAKTIKITFDEYVKIKDINKQLIVSPPLKNQPDVFPKGMASKFITVQITDTLQPNTTYTLNFGQSITDNNEGNPVNQYKYVFSTGSYIDSLQVSGSIKDALLQEPDTFVSVMLYDAQTYTDSIVYKKQPLYITNTLDSLKTFTISNIKQGTYKLVALKDVNKNNKFDPKTDKIGFINQAIELPTDKEFKLNLFKEKATFKTQKPSQLTQNKIIIPYVGTFENTTISATHTNKSIKTALTKFPDKDSVMLWLPKNITDSVRISVKNNSFSKDYNVVLKTLKKKDSLQINPTKAGVLHFREHISIDSSTPLQTINEQLISVQKADSSLVVFKSKYDGFNQKLWLEFPKEENQKYTVTLLPKAVTDIYETQNDTLSFTARTTSLSDYGNLKISIKNAKKYPLLIEILDKEEVVEQAVLTKPEEVYFDAILPRIYTLRVIIDENGNGMWDTGNILEQKQPEEVIYYPKGIDVRANWDVEQIFELE